MEVEELDSVSGHVTTGHEWNGIKELDTPVPRGVLMFLIVTHVFAVIPALLGVTVEYTILDRVWLAPWIGVLDLETRFDHNTGQCDAFYGYIDQQVEQRLAYGLGFGADMFILGRHRVGPFVQLARARHAYQPLQGSFTAGYYPDNFDDDLLVTFGVAYRYW